MKSAKKDLKISTKFLLYSVIIFLIGDLFVINTSWKDEYLSTKAFWVYIFAFIFTFLLFATESIKKVKQKNFFLLIGLMILMVIFSIVSIYKNPFLHVLKPSEIIFGPLDRGEGAHLWIVYIIFMIVGYVIVKENKKNLDIINNTLTLSGAIVAADGIFQYIFGKDILFLFKKPIEKYAYCFSLLGNQNFVGNFLALVLPISIVLYIKSKDKTKYFYLISILLQIVCLFCTRTRGAWIGAAMPLLVILIKAVKDKKIINVLIFTLVSLTLVLSINHLSGNSISKRINSIGQNANSVLNGEQTAGHKRILLWNKTIHFIKKRPIWGWGPNSMSSLIIISDEDVQKYWGISSAIINKCNTEYPKMFSKDARRYWKIKNTIIDKCHNEYLQIAYNSGVQSLIVYLVFLFYLIFRKFKTLLKDDVALGLTMGIIGYSIALFFSFSILSIHSWFFIIIGMVACEIFNCRGEESFG